MKSRCEVRRASNFRLPAPSSGKSFSRRPSTLCPMTLGKHDQRRVLQGKNCMYFDGFVPLLPAEPHFPLNGLPLVSPSCYVIHHLVEEGTQLRKGSITRAPSAGDLPSKVFRLECDSGFLQIEDASPVP